LIGGLAVEVIPYALPFRRTYKAAPGVLRRREMVLLLLRDDNGLEAFGEAVPLSLRGGEGLAAVVAALDEWAARAEQGEAPQPDGPAPARCAIATALADLEAKRLDIPLWEFLAGDREPNPVRCNGTIGAGPVPEVAEQAAALVDSGFSRVKAKVGTPGDAAMVRAIRDSIGDRALLRLDANGAWTPEQAISFVRKVGPDSIELLEQPARDLPGLAEVRESIDIPVVADESVATPDEAREAARLGACDAATVKISKVGGLDGRLGGHLPTYLSSALDGPVGIAAAGHLAATFPVDGPTGPLFHGLATGTLFDGTIALQGPEMEGETLRLPDGPGLGVELDRAALDRFRL
jgi:L-alanine-DL-glutamate epimerase-like enolase superfamily enzyme